MDTNQENFDGKSKDISIDIDIHRETGLVIVNKIDVPDQGIELTVDDIEALSDFARQHGDKLARSSDFNEAIKEGKRLTDDERRKIGKEKIAALRSKMNQIIDKRNQPDYLDTNDPQARLYYSKELKKIPSEISKMRKRYFKFFKLESKNEPYADSVMRALKAANKAKNAEAVVYYNDCLYNNSACASFERFKGSAAYDSWVRRHDIVDKIEKVKAEYKRFSWMESSEGTMNVNTSKCELCGKPVEPGTSSTLCPSCHEDSLSAAEKDMGVQEGGLHIDKGQTISTASMSETAPPNFPKSIYEKLVIKFKGDKKKINEVMWELHKKSKESGQSLDEKAPPGFPKDLHDRLLNQYKDEPAKAYATMWKIHNKHGDKLESVVNEIKKKKTVKKSDHVEDDEDEMAAKFIKSKSGKSSSKKNTDPDDWRYTDARNAAPTNGWN